MMFDGTSSEHERNDEDNKHFEEGFQYFIIAIWPRWSLIMVSTRRIKQYRISLSLSVGHCSIRCCLFEPPKKIIPPEKLKMRSTQCHTKNHFQKPTQSHGPQAIFTSYPFIDSKKNIPVLLYHVWIWSFLIRYAGEILLYFGHLARLVDPDLWLRLFSKEIYPYQK